MKPKTGAAKESFQPIPVIHRNNSSLWGKTMEKTQKLPGKILLFIILISGITIFFASVETVLKAKDTELFSLINEDFARKGMPLLEYSDYVFSVLSMYFMKIASPIGYTLTAYLSFKKFRFGKSFLGVWAIVLFGSLILHLLTMELYNIFYYLIAAGFLLLMGSIFMLRSEFVQQETASDKEEQYGRFK